jgi:ATP-dependent helicase/nuclease subunit A
VIRQVIKETNVDYPIDPVKEEILGFLHHREVKPYFVPKPGRTVRREQEFSDREGSLLRMDRVIMDEDRITVMDYKTGGEKKAEEKYFSQLKNYIRILKDLYPGREVAGLVAYVDLKEVVKVE